MAPSRCLPEPAVLARLLSGAGLRAAKGAEVDVPDGDWVHFEDTSNAPAPPPAPLAAPRGPVPPTRGADRAAPVTAPAPQESREVKPKSSPSAQPLAEVTDEKLSEEVFGAGARGLGVEQRLQRFVQWLASGTGASSAFVADLEGLPLVNRNTPEPYVVAIGPLARAQAEIARFVPDSPPGTSIVELDHQRLLEVVWADTPIGRLGVGVVLPEPLKHTLVTRIRRVAALSVVFRGDS